MGAPDYYAVLGVDRQTDAESLKLAYRRLAIRLHPDRHPDDDRATARFQTLVDAWSILGDPERRKAYDSGELVRVRPVEPGSTVQELFGRVVDGVFGVRSKRPIEGRNHRYDLRISFAEMALGATKALELPRLHSCPSCAGRGFEMGTVPELCERCQGAGEIQRRKTLRSTIEDCPDCDGRGYIISEPCSECLASGAVTRHDHVDIEVPPGVKDGDRLLIRGAGEPGRHGGRPGDCFVYLAVEPHDRLERDGRDVALQRPVTIFDALLGARVTVPTVRGAASITVPRGLRSGTVLRMAGYGVHDPRGESPPGDQLVRVEVEMPAALDDEAEAALSLLRDGLTQRCGAAEVFPQTTAFGRADEGDP